MQRNRGVVDRRAGYAVSGEAIIAGAGKRANRVGAAGSGCVAVVRAHQALVYVLITERPAPAHRAVASRRPCAPTCSALGKPAV